MWIILSAILALQKSSMRISASYLIDGGILPVGSSHTLTLLKGKHTHFRGRMYAGTRNFPATSASPTAFAFKMETYG